MISYAKFKTPNGGIFERKLYYLNDSMLDESIELAHETLMKEYGFDIDDIALYDLVKDA